MMTHEGKRLTGRTALVTWAVLFAAACPGANVEQELNAVTADRLEKFSSDGEFDDYVSRVSSLRPSGLGCADARMAENAASVPPSAEDGESITNNQEQGVDEGDIVKAAGDFLVVLRRGRLFTIRERDANGEALAPVSQIPASPPGFTQGSWYDELLIFGDRIVVVGFSYQVGATEIGLFRLGPTGTLSHEDSYFLTSNDYYSSRNYASRLVGGKLVFYMPYFLGGGGGAPVPSLRKWVKDDELTEWNAILSKRDTYRPVQRTVYPALHTVVQCDLSQEELSCSARGVVGPHARAFYVSRENVYLWVGSEYGNEETKDGSSAYLYRMSLLTDEVAVVKGRGMPVDQFSFKETAEGGLNVLLVESGGGDELWHPEIAQGDLALLRLGASAFGSVPAAAPAEAYTRLPSAGPYALQNRFVGDHLLWGAGGGWGSQTDVSQERVFVTRVSAPDQVAELPLGHAVDRLEVLGSGAAVIGRHGTDLHFSAISLGEAAAVAGTHLRPNAAQGETRSHGFFFKPNASGGGGVLGLPVRLDGEPYRHLMYGSAEVTFLEVSPSLQLSPLGSLTADPNVPQDDACTVSCVDWYGNARPIFYRGRIIALLGYELVEGTLGATGIQEKQRAQFLTVQ